MTLVCAISLMLALSNGKILLNGELSTYLWNYNQSKN